MTLAAFEAHHPHLTMFISGIALIAAVVAGIGVLL